MICYRDMTFCPFYEDCAHASECHRPLTREVEENAKRADLPISRFMEMPSCHSENEAEE